jgi:hypothetical protein
MICAPQTPARVLAVHMVRACVRTVSRHFMAHQDGLEGARIDWTNPPAPIEFSITGRFIGLLRCGDATIATATGREQIPFDVIEGDPQVLKQAEWHFHWLRDESGQDIIGYRPGEQARQTRHARQSPEARARVSEIQRDLLKRRIKKLAGIDVSAGQERS